MPDPPRRATDVKHPRVPATALHTAGTFRSRFASLSPKQQAICRMMVRGAASREIATDLGISVNTVKVHRKEILRRMQVRSTLELVQMFGVGLAHDAGRDHMAATAQGVDPGNRNTSLSTESLPPRPGSTASPTDIVTGLDHETPFLRKLDEHLCAPMPGTTGTVVLLRIEGLAELNRAVGRATVDALLVEAGLELRHLVAMHPGWCAARRNGADFLLLAPDATEPKHVAQEGRQVLRSALAVSPRTSPAGLLCAATVYSRGETAHAVIRRLDAALQMPQPGEHSGIRIADRA